MAYRFWTAKDLARAKELRASGTTFKEIARELGRSANAVFNALNDFQKLGRSCSECSAPIRDANKGGRCRACTLRSQNLTNAEFTDRRLEALRASAKQAIGSPGRRAAARKAAAVRMSDPDYRARLIEFMRTVVSPASRKPENMAKRNARAASAKRSAIQMSWCPEEYRPLYLKLRPRLRAAGAKAAVLEQIAKDKANLSPFERQMRALERGAKLVANDTKPLFGQPADYGERKWVR